MTVTVPSVIFQLGNFHHRLKPITRILQLVAVNVPKDLSHFAVRLGTTVVSVTLYAVRHLPRVLWSRKRRTLVQGNYGESFPHPMVIVQF
jgi:hypothetical protein